MSAAPDTLELYDAEGALERLESWLREHGFFTPNGADLVADLYLGYGLSSTIRRHSAPPPPEPCPLPLVACTVRPRDYVVEDDNEANEIRFGAWQRTWEPSDYARAVAAVREALAT